MTTRHLRSKSRFAALRKNNAKKLTWWLRFSDAQQQLKVHHRIDLISISFAPFKPMRFIFVVHSIEILVILVEIDDYLMVGDYLESGYNYSYIGDNHFVIVG